MSRRFTLAEAGRLLPHVGRLIREAVRLKAEMAEAEALLQGVSHQITLSGGMVVDRSRALEARSQRDSSARGLKSALEKIEQTGCVVKDLDVGLVDFPTLFRGSEVYLCWKLDEPAIRFWHGVDEGFAGRKPIDQEFLDNHRGEPAK
ncbi:MAG: DUF2203 family protein [Acidobacteria bacterium]|nr:DUF2203 family protein [Acidobacteriota bacterium]